MKVTKVLEYRINWDIYIPYTNTAGAGMMLLLKEIFGVFRLMKNIIFNMTVSYVGRNTSNNACSTIFLQR
jgi:hypothetical protein